MTTPAAFDAATGDLIMPRLNFGAFLAPHHPIGEHPMLQFRRDLDLVEHLDKLGYDEFWCGEHHSSGWEMIGSPEMFLAGAGDLRLRAGCAALGRPHAGDRSDAAARPPGRGHRRHPPADARRTADRQV